MERVRWLGVEHPSGQSSESSLVLDRHWVRPSAPDETHYFAMGRRHLIEVEVCFRSSGEPVVTGMSVRRAMPLTRPAKDTQDRLRQIRDHGLRPYVVGEPRPLSARDVRRMALDTYSKAALAYARTRDTRPGKPIRDSAAAVRFLAPRDRPNRRNPDFYRRVLDAFETLVARGERKPAKVLAERMDVADNVNLVHQWVFRARELDRQGRLPARRKR